MQRVVIVADNPLIVEGIIASLRRDGQFEILGRVDGRTASVAAIVKATPDVVIVDDMQHGDGTVSVIREIKASAPKIFVLLLTVRMEDDWLAEAFEAGANGAISKNVTPSALGPLVREIVNGNVVHLFAATGRRKAVAIHDCPLTSRELEVLHLLTAGRTNAEIARQLWVTEQTVKFHVSKIYRKFGVSNRTGASHYAHMNGLVEGGRTAVGA